jgi:hypothetical protein
MKLISLLSMAMVLAVTSFAQSKTTETLNKKYADSNAFFFYNNTLRMLNQNDDKDFDALVKDIEKMKLLLIKKPTAFGKQDYKRITGDYKAESFEEIMTSRYKGKNLDVYLREQNGKTKGMVILVNDSASLYVLDIVGKIALEKVTKLYSIIDQNSEIGMRIQSLTSDEHKKHMGDHNH